jgi:hypothetical protein
MTNAENLLRDVPWNLLGVAINIPRLLISEHKRVFKRIYSREYTEIAPYPQQALKYLWSHPKSEKKECRILGLKKILEESKIQFLHFAKETEFQ